MRKPEVGRLRSLQRRTQVVIVSATAMALGASGLAVATASAGTPGPVRIAAAAQLPRGAATVGATPASTTVTGGLVLKPRDPQGLSSFLAGVTDPSSSTYRQYLAPGQFAGRFGPSAATVAAARSALTAHGLAVAGTADGGMVLQFRGSAAHVESAFSTRLQNVRLADGSVRHATSSVSVPASIASSVTSVVGLNTLVTPQAINPIANPTGSTDGHPAAVTGSFAHPAGAPNACPDATSDALSSGGLTDDQIANAYGAFGLYGAGDLGAGQRIGVFELESYARSDIRTFDACYFGAIAAAQMANRLHTHPVDGGQPAGYGSGESLLDIEDVSAMAPKATIDVYTAPNTTFGSIDEYAQMVNADADQVITTSWGFCEQAAQLADPGSQQAENQIFEQAAAQGQTVFSAAGDTGEDDCNAFRTPNPASGQNPVSVDDPSSQPYVVGVGGTTITNAATSPAGEQVWNDGAQWGAGGGGISQSWGMPSWQQHATVPGISMPGSADYAAGNQVEQQFGYPQGFCEASANANLSAPCRLVPDVSAQADEFTGAVTVYSGSFTQDAPDGWITYGGTSSATPIWAALYADIDASPTCQASAATHRGAGFASPLLYQVASDPASYAASFNDITSGDNDIYGLDNGQLYAARTGYDLASGLGSPRLTGSNGSAGLAYYLCSDAAGTTRPAVTGLSPQQGGVAGGTVVTVTGSQFESDGSPDVTGVQVGTASLPANRFKVTSPTTMQVIVPAAAAALPPQAQTDGGGAVQIVVTLADGASSATTAASTFQYVDTTGTSTVPDVTSVGPYAGLQSSPGSTTIYGSGFTGATQVTFGGVPAASFTVVSPNRITATPAPYSTATRCRALPTTGVYAGENAGNDMCQVQVRVTGPGGRSATSQILPPPEGPITAEPNGAYAPPGCQCELAPAATEYDYVPAPTVTSISTSGGPTDLADENGGTVVTVHGTGLGIQTLDWADFGPVGQETSQDTNVVYATGTELQVTAPAQALTTTPFGIPFSVKTIAGQSNSLTAQYAGVPTVSSVVNTANSTTLNGISGGPDTGGTPIAIHGTGLSGQVIAPIKLDGTNTIGTQYSFSVASPTEIDTQTVAQNPGLLDIQVCTVTGCSATSSADEFLLYPPGTSQVNSVSPASGPAAGGTSVTVGGQNLGCALQVYFGNTPAASVTPTPGYLDCGSAVQLTATTPAHAGGAVPVTVETAADYYTGAGRGTTNASFTFK